VATSAERFREELADLLGLAPGSPELDEAQSKLAEGLGCKPGSPQVLEAARRLAAARITAERFDTTMAQAIDEGRAVPSERPRLRRLFKRHPETALRVIHSLKPVTVVEPSQPLARDNIDPAALDLDRRVRAFALEHDLPYAAALEAVRRRL
jgi:hypothetical protein